jgi:hypothetical protein
VCQAEHTKKPWQHLPHSNQATSTQAAELPQKKRSLEAGKGVTCPAGMDSKESEQPRAMGRSSGVRLSVDERLLAKASSCTNMIPAERWGGRAGKRREQLFNKGAGPWATGMAGG